MGLTKRFLEIQEWADDLTERYEGDVLPYELARHLIRTLGFRTGFETPSWHFSDDGSREIDDPEKLLSECHKSILAVCYAWFEDEDCCEAHINLGYSFDQVVEPNALFQGESFLRHDFSPTSYEAETIQNSGRIDHESLFNGDTVLDENKITIRTAMVHLMKVLEQHSEWSFWARWMQGFLDGQPIDWHVQRQVALLDLHIWNAGPEAVAAAIHEIETKHNLQTEIADLRARMEEMRLSLQAPPQGHNQGPPLDDAAAAQIPRQFELVWPLLDGLEEEAVKAAPDPERLKSLALALWEIAQKIVGYCGGVLDLGLKKAAETLGEEGTKWTVRVLAADAVASNAGIQSVAKAAWKYALALGGG